jgi:hypothetical protein
MSMLARELQCSVILDNGAQEIAVYVALWNKLLLSLLVGVEGGVELSGLGGKLVFCHRRAANFS